VPIVDSSGAIVLLNESGGRTAITGPNVATRSPLATVDWTGRCGENIIFLDQSTNELRVIDHVGESSQVIRTVTDNGGPIVADPDVGVR
jgi:hypothetical protein